MAASCDGADGSGGGLRATGTWSGGTPLIRVVRKVSSTSKRTSGPPWAPKTILSPERSACVRTSLPFTKVPFVEPTSNTT